MLSDEYENINTPAIVVKKKKLITLPTGKVVEDWSTDWLDSTISTLYLLYDGNEYKASFEILPKYEVIENIDYYKEVQQLLQSRSK